MLEVKHVKEHENFLKLMGGRVTAYTENNGVESITNIGGDIIELHGQVKKDQEFYTLNALCEFFPQVKDYKAEIANMQADGRKEKVVSDNTIIFVVKVTDNLYWTSGVLKY